MAAELFDVLEVDANGNETSVHTMATDIWAFGTVAYELLSESIPYSNYKGDFGVPSAIVRGVLPAKPQKRISVRFILLALLESSPE